jgi:hypothetical protein
MQVRILPSQPVLGSNDLWEVAQSVAQGILNPKAGGSSPPLSARDKGMRKHEDNSGIVESAMYRCANRDCFRKSRGSELRPVVYERLKDDPSCPAGVAGTGVYACNVRRCPYCRGSVVLM